jgi:hypothetical protein
MGKLILAVLIVNRIRRTGVLGGRGGVRVSQWEFWLKAVRPLG